MHQNPSFFLLYAVNVSGDMLLMQPRSNVYYIVNYGPNSQLPGEMQQEAEQCKYWCITTCHLS